MPPAKKKRKSSPVEVGSMDELVKLAALYLKYNVPQGVLVHDLSDAGLAPVRIAELLGTTPNTVSQQRRTKRPEWPPK